MPCLHHARAARALYLSRACIITSPAHRIHCVRAFRLQPALLRPGQASSRPWRETIRAAASAPTAEAPVRLQDLEAHIGPLSPVPEPQPLVLVISGPSGVGKDAVLRRLQELRPDLFFVVTATTRPKRAGEVDGKDYIFVSKATFEQWIQSEQLLEHALVYGDYKGIPKDQVTGALARGTDVALRLDVQGAATVRKLYPHAIFLFLVAESEQSLVQRLVERKSEPLDSMILRIRTAQQELSCMDSFDYVVTNRDGELESTVQQINAIMEAEKCTVRRLFGRKSS